MTTTSEIVSNGFAQRYTNILQTLIVISIAIAGMWGAVVLPIEQRLQRLQDDMKGLVSLREYDEFKKRSDNSDTNTVSLVAKNSLDVGTLRSDFVSKDVLAGLRSEVESLKSMFGGQYTIADKVKDLQHQIEQLRLSNENSNVGKPK